MVARSERIPSSEPVRNRCRCGHYPTTHLRVAPIVTRGGAGYLLELGGPCSVCREPSCTRFSPSV